jgi:hypothetical protein
MDKAELERKTTGGKIPCTCALLQKITMDSLSKKKVIGS